jgi:hypothetical protein
MKKKTRKDQTQGKQARKDQPQKVTTPAPKPLSEEQLSRVAGGEGHKGPPNGET